ncbi:hypothetical protein OH77DRAFT_233229 [Trametes cingulata]|nr:hypothetical protein OH77DRAFT_233229 [Trametes cingulata]
MSITLMGGHSSSQGPLIPTTTAPTIALLPLLDPFRLNLQDPFIQRYITVVSVDGDEYYQLSDAIAGTLWFFLIEFADRIRAASHGYLPGVTLGTPPTITREGSYHELGLPAPRVFEYLEQVHGHNPVQGRWPAEIWRNAWTSLQRIGLETTRWIELARFRTRSLSGAVGWIFDEIDLNARAAWTEGLGYGPGAMVVHPLHGTGAHAALVPYRPEQPYFGVESRGALDNPCRDVIVHPIWGSGANSALIRREPSIVSVLLDSLCDTTPRVPPNSPVLAKVDADWNFEDDGDCEDYGDCEEEGADNLE